MTLAANDMTANSEAARCSGSRVGARHAPMPRPQNEPNNRNTRAPRQPSMEQVMESDEFAEYMSGAQSLERNALVTGTVVRLEENGSILVDIGSKSEGIIPRSELGDEEVNVGDEVECVVVRPEDDEGHPILSKRRADFEKTRRDIAAARESGEDVAGHRAARPSKAASSSIWACPLLCRPRTLTSAFAASSNA